jgi:two-component system, OmpR family, alkaline phosphatase synthesis response regulator PhoP
MTRAKPLILIADDESHILHVVALKLGNAGYDIVTAADGEEALELALERLPDLLITDYHMPHLNGLDLCRKLTSHARTAHVPALMLTARGAALTDEEVRGTNISGVLSKPFSPREVLLRVRELLSVPQEVAGGLSG